MKKTILLAIAVALTLAACGGIKADVADNDVARATQAIVEKWIAAYQTYDPSTLISLYSDDITWIDYGKNDGPHHGGMNGLIHSTFDSQVYKLRVDSYIITRDGRFAVIQGAYSEKNGISGKWASTPAVAILEFKDGKIIRETWYYNTGVFYK